MDRIKDCGRIAKDVTVVAEPGVLWWWNGSKMIETGEVRPPCLFVPNGRMVGEFMEEEDGAEWELPPEWQALLVLP